MIQSTLQPPQRRNRPGFTITELLLAITLLIAGLTSVLLLFPAGARMQMDAVNDTAGRAFAEAALSAVRGNANLLAANNIFTDNVTQITPIPSNTPGLPVIPTPTGTFDYRVCYWQPVFWDSTATPPAFAKATGHFNVAIFSFNSTLGNIQLDVVPNGNVTSPGNGLSTITFTALPDPLAQDQQVILQNLNPTVLTNDVYVAHVVSVSVNTSGTAVVTIAPALPTTFTSGLRMIYLPQRASAIATGSVQ